MINNINFKKWLVKSEAIEYQPENWLKFHRQMTNKFKKFEEKYTKEFFQKIKKGEPLRFAKTAIFMNSAITRCPLRE